MINWISTLTFQFFVIFCLTKMVNKCVAFGYSSRYHTNKEKVSTFTFPLEKSNLEKWVKFVNRNDYRIYAPIF